MKPTATTRLSRFAYTKTRTKNIPMQETQEAELISACKQGSRSAFNALVREHQERVYWAVRRFILDPDDAKDIAQDVFVRAWQSLDGFREESKVSTWLYRIAVNLSLNYLRKQKLRAALRFSEQHEQVLASSPEASTELEADEITALVERAIQTLPQKQRMVFVMRYYDETPYEEMARLLHRSVGGLKANYHHAVKKVQEFIHNEMR